MYQERQKIRNNDMRDMADNFYIDSPPGGLG